MSFSISGKGAAALIGCAALSLSVAGCSSSGSGSSATGSSAGSVAASSHAATTAAADPDAGLPTGTQLKADLLSTGLPSGYSLDSSGSVDTGSDYQSPSDSQPTGGSDCSNLAATSWVDFAGHGSVSFAENDYVDKGTSEEFAQEIDAFQGTTAQAVMTALADITAKCPSYKDSSTSSTVKVSVATSASPQDGSVVITLSNSAWEGTTTLEAVRVGQTVVTVLCSTTSGSATMAKSTATQIAARVAAGSR
jgi:hypothetical protein